MKGWLDKYEYGGEAGYTDVPFNYNSAWGGQFEDGGYIPQAQNGRSFWETASQFIPVYEQFLDIKDIVQGAFTGDTEMRNRGIVGMTAPVSGKALMGGLDYLTEKFLGKEAADYNEDKRKSIINSPTFNRALFEKYGWGGYDKWVKDGKPPLYEQGGSLPGAVGFTYARTGGIPSNGPYAKKTKASAQEGNKIPNDKSTQEFWKKLEDYYTSDIASDVDRAKYKTFKEYNEQHGYAPVRITDRTIMGKRQMTNPFTGELNVISPDENDPEYASSLMNQYLDEYPHYQQFNKNPNESNLRKSLRFIGGMGKDFGTMLTNLPSSGFNFQKAYDKTYHTPGTSEYEAHAVLEPQMDVELKSMLEKNLPPKQENGGMTYYQHGLDWQPKTISRDGSIIKDDRGQWAHPGEITKINSNRITMKGVPYPVLGISDEGDTQMMYPEQEYKFKGKKVTEIPLNKKSTGGWLDKYN